MKDAQIIGEDPGKNSCSVVGLDAVGQVALRRRGAAGTSTTSAVISLDPQAGSV
jgi:hypothetical protein